MKKDCFTPKVLQADCDTTPITFLTVEVEGVDDTQTPPANGEYYNTIVKYLQTGRVYLYNSVGIPTLMNQGTVDDDLSSTSKNPVQNKVVTEAIDETNRKIHNEIADRESDVELLASQIQAEMITRETADNTLSVKLTDETSARTSADTALAKQIEDETSAREEAVEAIGNKIDKTVVQDISLDSSPSTDVVTMQEGKVNIGSGATVSTEIPFPVASSTQAGIMNSSTFNAIQSNSENVGVLLNSSVAISNLPETPTQDELTTAWETTTGQSELVNGASIYDSTNTKTWKYFTNDTTWHDLGSGGGSVTVSQWTNTSAGVIKGSQNIGQLFAEADGTGSVNGWDAINSQVNNNTSAITAKQDILSETQMNAVNSGITAEEVTRLNNLTVNDGALTIQKNGETIDTFTANQDGDTTANVQVSRTLTQAEYDALTDEEKMADIIYFISDGESPEAVPIDGSVTTEKLAVQAVKADNIDFATFVQRGRILSSEMTPFTSGSNTWSRATITFDTPFTTTPTVITTLYDGNPASYGLERTAIQAVSTTSFTAVLSVKLNTSVYGIDWIAIGS